MFEFKGNKFVYKAWVIFVVNETLSNYIKEETINAI